MLSRERALLSAQELQISHRLTAAMQDLEAKYALMETYSRRYEATRQKMGALEEGFRAGRLTLDLAHGGPALAVRSRGCVVPREN